MHGFFTKTTAIFKQNEIGKPITDELLILTKNFLLLSGLGKQYFYSYDRILAVQPLLINVQSKFKSNPSLKLSNEILVWLCFAAKICRKLPKIIQISKIRKIF